MDKYQVFADWAEGTVRPMETMAGHTTFAIGGPCDLYLEPQDRDQVRQALAWVRKEGLPLFVLGKGSNLLVSDDGIEGVVLSLDGLAGCQIQGREVVCEAGVDLADLCDQVAEAGLSGLEFACGIPGSLGGAIYMNAGAYGGEMKDVVTEVEVMDAEGNILRIPAQDMDFAYRTSRLKQGGLICLSATMVLTEQDPSRVRQEMDRLTAEREAKQPLEWPSAGSTFKRPPGYYAGKLIIDAGMQGAQVGGAQVSTKHAGFIVNLGGATAQDVADLIAKVQQAVRDHAGVDMETEVRFIGRWPQG